MSISAVVLFKFVALYGLIYWYTTTQSRKLKAEVAEAKAREAASLPSTE